MVDILNTEIQKIQILPLSEEAQYRQLLTQTNQERLLVFQRSKAKERFDLLVQNLLNVTPYYAVKSCSHPELLKTLNDIGCNFDVATTGEIRLLQELNINANKTIHTHPIKSDQDIKDGIEYGCTAFVVDNLLEIDKFIPYANTVQLLLRLSFPNPNNKIDLSKKFGCTVADTDVMLQRCSDLGLSVLGISFHVGSQTLDNQYYIKALEQCVKIFNDHPKLKVLDIGGGFPVEYLNIKIDYTEYFKPINNLVQTFIQKGIRVICEPGRFISGPSFYSISSVVGMSERNNQPWYYINNGVYGLYSGVIFDYVQYQMCVFSSETEVRPSMITGPTCDSIDMIASDVDLPNLKIGDLIIGFNMGAYTLATCSKFNGIEIPLVLDID